MKFTTTASQNVIISAIQARKNGECWVVGGAIRDILTNQIPVDLDLVTNLLPDKVIEIAKLLKLISIPDQTAYEHGIVRVVDKDTGDLIDIATLRRDDNCNGRHAEVSFTTSLEEDLGRRDLTINAMAAAIKPDGTILEIIDPFNGQKDLENKLLKTVGEADKRIKEDYLRMLRICRFFALGDGWNTTADIDLEIWAKGEHINEISRERVRDELLKAMSYPKPGNFVRALDDFNLLQYVIPPVYKCIDVEQNEYHNETVDEHLFATLDAAAELDTSPLLRLSALLHDVGKVDAREVIDGRTHFYKHDVIGATIVYNYMKSLKFSNNDIQYVVSIVRNHQWRFEASSKDKTVRRWLQKVGKDTWRDLITIRCADRRGNFAKRDKPMVTKEMHYLMDTAQRIIDENQALFKEDLEINGNDLKALGIKPGKIYTKIFSNLLGIVVADPEKNKKDWLLNFVQKNYAPKE